LFEEVEENAYPCSNARVGQIEALTEGFNDLFHIGGNSTKRLRYLPTTNIEDTLRRVSFDQSAEGSLPDALAASSASRIRPRAS